MTQVAIIGAGITGLTAAHALLRAGVSVTLYEAADRAGGVIVSHRDGPWLAEGGPNTLLETSPRITAFLEELGLSGRRLESSPRATARFVVRNRRPVPLPTSPVQFLVSPLFSPGAKLRLLREPFIGRGEGDESVAEFVRRRLGAEFLEYAIDPLVTGIYAGDPARLSIRHAFAKIHALEAEYGSLIRGQILGARARRRRGEISKAHAPKLSFDDGLQVLTDTLAARARDALRLRTRVERVSRTPDGWHVASRCTEADSGSMERHACVLFCGTAHTLAAMHIDAHGVPDVSALAEIEYPPVTSVVLGFRRADVRHPCEGFGMLIPDSEGFRILGTIFSSALFPNRAPAGHLTLTTYVGGARHPEIAAMEDDALRELVVRELDRLLGVSGAPVYSRITRWRRAIPQYTLGYERHKNLLDRLEAAAPGFFVAGNFRNGVALSDSILAGLGVAGRVVKHLDASVAARPAAATS